MPYKDPEKQKEAKRKSFNKRYTNPEFRARETERKVQWEKRKKLGLRVTPKEGGYTVELTGDIEWTTHALQSLFTLERASVRHVDPSNVITNGSEAHPRARSSRKRSSGDHTI